MLLIGLPPEILSSIFDLISVSDFFSVTTSCKSLHAFQNDPMFWRTKVRADFRIPPQPLLEDDVKRWQWIYKMFSTRSTVFTWGNDSQGNLGRPSAVSTLKQGWPEPMSGLEDVGHVADVQCGGWSTVLLSTRGRLWAAGVIDGQRSSWITRHDANIGLVEVKMPMRAERRWFVDISHRTIKEFSMGRQRLVALSDEGEVIEWTSNFTVAGEILTIDEQRADAEHKPESSPKLVVAGWGHGSAYYLAHGLHYWTTAGTLPEQERGATNQILNPSPGSDVRLVPGTMQPDDTTNNAGPMYIGPLKKYLVLENHIIMLTTAGKLFSWHIPDANDSSHFERNFPTELANFYATSSGKDLVDLQGSFRNFAVFSKDGGIQTCVLDGSILQNTPRQDLGGNQLTLPQPNVNPGLQNADVIQLAFGDYHYHALHSSGVVTSYGKDPNCCGALGLGVGGVSLFRGVDCQSHDAGNLLVHPESDGRRTVWFEPEKFTFLLSMLKNFMQELNQGGIMEQMVRRRGREFWETYGEWFEREGRAWNLGPRSDYSDSETTGDAEPNGIEDDGIVPYFALKIAAAGWSSAALVLVDEEKAQRVREKHLLPEFRSPPSVDRQVDTDAPTTSPSSFRWTDVFQRLMPLGIFRLVGLLESQSNDPEEADKYIWSSQNFPVLREPGNADIEQGVLTGWRGTEPGWLRP